VKLFAKRIIEKIDNDLITYSLLHASNSKVVGDFAQKLENINVHPTIKSYFTWM
jgi:hypothetical protein